MTGDVLELSVTRPPTSDQAALALAREQFSYSPDIVQRGVNDIETLAASLKTATPGTSGGIDARSPAAP
jgi:hypothetical protein